MTQTSIELAGEVMDALSHQGLDRLIGLADPEVEWHSFFAELGAGRDPESAIAALGTFGPALARRSFSAGGKGGQSP